MALFYSNPNFTSNSIVMIILYIALKCSDVGWPSTWLRHWTQAIKHFLAGGSVRQPVSTLEATDGRPSASFIPTDLYAVLQRLPLPTMSLSKLSQFGTKRVARGIGRLSQEVLESGSGSYLTTTEGRKLLDFTSGIGVTNLGHCHPSVTKAAQEQVGKLVHGQVNIAFQKPYLYSTLAPLSSHRTWINFES